MLSKGEESMVAEVRKLARSWILAAFLTCAAFLTLAPHGTLCQQVAIRDLTQPRPPAPIGPQPGDFSEDYKNACGSSIADGVIEDKGDNLSLSIVDAKKVMLDGQARIVVTARLKSLNVYAPAEIPWETCPIIAIQTDPKDPTVKSKAATIWVWMNLPGKPREIANLAGGVNFCAQPNNSAQHLKLRPGEWVDIKFSVGVVCKSYEEPVCSSYLQGDAVQLTAWWYERELTHLRKGCEIKDGAYTSREFKSTTFDFVQPITAKPEGSTPNLPASPKAN
jgi:hypothetical protein